MYNRRVDFVFFLFVLCDSSRSLETGLVNINRNNLSDSFTKNYLFAFTTCGSKTSTVVTTFQCRSAYRGSNLENITVEHGFQKWEVPLTGVYRFTITGASQGLVKTDAGVIKSETKRFLLAMDVKLVGQDYIHISVGNAGTNFTCSEKAKGNQSCSNHGIGKFVGSGKYTSISKVNDGGSRQILSLISGISADTGDTYRLVNKNEAEYIVNKIYQNNIQSLDATKKKTDTIYVSSEMIWFFDNSSKHHSEGYIKGYGDATVEIVRVIECPCEHICVCKNVKYDGGRPICSSYNCLCRNNHILKNKRLCVHSKETFKTDMPTPDYITDEMRRQKLLNGKWSVLVAILVVALVGFVAFLIVLKVYLKRKSKRKKVKWQKTFNKHSGGRTPNGYSLVTIKSNPELKNIGRSRIKITKLLGSGAFGEVYEGELSGKHNADARPVAIKVLSDSHDSRATEDFRLEAAIMSFGHWFISSENHCPYGL